MVDLVKLRKKAKEKKAGEQVVEPPKPADDPKSAAKTPEPEAKPTQTKRAAKSAPEPQPEKPPSQAAAAPEPKAEPKAESKAKAETKPASQGETEQRKTSLERFKETAGRLAAQQQAETKAFDEATAEIEQIELLTLHLAGEHYAVPIEKIVEIVTPRPVTKVPNADEWILGIISLRGTIVTILDLRRKLGHPQQMSLGLDARIIVVENSGETTGFLVDKVARVVRIDPSVLESHPVVATTEQSEYIRGVFQSPQGLAIVLDLERLIRI